MLFVYLVVVVILRICQCPCLQEAGGCSSQTSRKSLLCGAEVDGVCQDRDCCKCSSALSCNAATPGSLFSLFLSPLVGVFALLFLTLSFTFTCQFSRLFSSYWYVQTGFLFSASVFWLWYTSPDKRLRGKRMWKNTALMLSCYCCQTSSLKDDKEDWGRALMWQDVQARKRADKPNVALETGQWKAMKSCGSRGRGVVFCCTGSMLRLEQLWPEQWWAVDMYTGHQQNSWGPGHMHVLYHTCLRAK